jgi:hypothetical protein
MPGSKLSKINKMIDQLLADHGVLHLFSQP